MANRGGPLGFGVLPSGRGPSPQGIADDVALQADRAARHLDEASNLLMSALASIDAAEIELAVGHMDTEDIVEFNLIQADLSNFIHRVHAQRNNHVKDAIRLRSGRAP